MRSRPIRFFKQPYNIILCMSPSQVTIYTQIIVRVMSQQWKQLSNQGTVHKFLQNFTFHENVSSRLLLYLGMLGLRWSCACIYEWTWSKGPLLSKKMWKLWKSMYKINGELSSYEIAYSGQSSVHQRATTKLCIISSLKWMYPKLLKVLLLGF